MIVISKHAYERAKERLGLKAAALKKLCALAFCYGKEMHETKGQLLYYLKRRKDEHPHNEFRIYGDNLFIFKDTLLVTVYRLPNEVNKIQFYKK